MSKTILSSLCFILLILSSCGTTENTQSTKAEKPISQGDQEVRKDSAVVKTKRGIPGEPAFKEIDIDFSHDYDKKKALAFLGGTFFDLDADGQKEFIITGGSQQNDGVFTYKDGSIIDITEASGINNTLPSYGAYAIDFDKNAYDDLFIARQDGIYYYENISGKFSEKKLDISLPKNAVPLDIDFADIDGDGDLDMYVSTFINQDLFKAATFNNSSHVQSNILLENNGDLNFKDITTESGLNVQANTFTASFVDLDNDNDPDIVISPNTDSIKIYKNTAGKFEQVFEGDIYGFWMGLAISDIDRDGDQDIFFSNVGTSIPEKLLGGDSREDQRVVSQYLFLENTGGMNFLEKKSPSFDELGFGWGIVPVDFNLDEYPDYLIMQNYIKWAPHKFSKLSGELLITSPDGTLNPSIQDYSLVNKNYGISALVGDINGDNFDDVIYLNLNSEPKVFLREADINNNFLKINFPNTGKYLGARFELFSGDKKIIEKRFLPKQGLMTRQDSSITFGLNQETLVPDILKVSFVNGEEININVDKSNIIQL